MSRLQWTALLIAVLAIACVAWYFAYQAAHDKRVDTDFEREVIKLGLQFVLVTIVGGVVLAFVNARKDQDAREHLKDAAVRDMVAHVLAVHGKFKTVKRRLRSRIAGGCAPGERRRMPPFRIAAEDFEKAMEDLLAAQIEAEQVRDSVRARDDLLSGRRIDRIHRALDYAARYYHDAYLEYEDCVIRRGEDGFYEVTEGCPNLVDFVGRSAWSHDNPGGRAAMMDSCFTVLGDENEPIEERYDALRSFAEAADASTARRYRIVATLAIVLASADLQRSVRRQRWRAFAREAMAKAEAELAAKEAAAAVKAAAKAA
jgi:hypothetical protein